MNERPLQPALEPWPAIIRWPVLLVLVVLGAALYGAHVLDTGRPLLAYVSTVPWILIAVHPRLRGRGNALAYFVSLHLMVLVGIYWLREQSTASWLVAPVMYYPLAMLSYVLVLWTRRRWPTFPLAILWPIVFTGVEWFRVRASPGELALCLLGTSQIVLTKLVQVADLVGVAGVTFLLAAFAGLFADAIISLSHHTSWRTRMRRLVPQAVFVLVLFACVLGYGVVRDTESHFSEGPSVHVVQPATARSSLAAEARHIHDLQVVQTLSSVPEGASAIFWPENSITVPYGARTPEGGVLGWSGPFIPDLQRLAARLGRPILADGWTNDPAAGADYHTACFVQPDGDVQLYDKVRLLPWTEYVPMRAVFAPFGQGAIDAWQKFVKSFVGVIPLGRLGPVSRLRPFELKLPSGATLLFGTPICFEIATARVVNKWHQQGADFLVNQTSEGRLGDTIHEMTIAISGFRAIEGRVSVVRATNEGISALIDPNGRVREILLGRYTGSTINEAGAFTPRIILDDRRGTIYTRIGDAFAIACFAVAMTLGIAAAISETWRRRRRPAAPVVVDVPSPA